MAQFNIQDYDRYIVSFSGGKDSTATFLYLLDHGIPREKSSCGIRTSTDGNVTFSTGK